MPLTPDIEQLLEGSHDRRLTFEQLRSFVAVAQDGGFGRAGEVLNRSQSAITQSLRRLEEILGCRLLERKQGHIGQLTGEGRQFLVHARDLLARAADAVQALKLEPLAGKVKVGVPDDFEIGRLHGLIARCSQRHPGLRIEVRSGQSTQLQQLFDDEQLDVVLIKRVVQPLPAARSGTVRLLMAEPMAWVHPRCAALHEFDELPLIVFPEGCAYRRAALHALGEIGKRWYVAYVSASYGNVRSAIEAGLGVGILPRGGVGGSLCELGAAQGFPPLPSAELMVMQRPGDPARQLIVDLIEASHHGRARDAHDGG